MDFKMQWGGRGASCYRRTSPYINRNSSTDLSTYIRGPRVNRFGVGVGSAIKMKFLAVFVALTCVLGSQAFVFPWHEEHRTRFEEARDAFWNYVRHMSDVAEDTLEAVKSSEMGQDINDRIAQSVGGANMYAAAVSEKVRPLAEDLVEQLSANAELMRQQISANLAEVNQRLAPFASQLQEQLIAGVSELGNSLKDRVDIDTEALSLEIQEMARLRLEDFKAKMAPYSQEVQLKVDQGIEQFRQGLVPFVEEMHVKMVQRAQELRENLQPYAEDVSAKLSTYDREVRQKITSILEEMHQEN